MESQALMALVIHDSDSNVSLTQQSQISLSYRNEQWSGHGGNEEYFDAIHRYLLSMHTELMLVKRELQEKQKRDDTMTSIVVRLAENLMLITEREQLHREIAAMEAAIFNGTVLGKFSIGLKRMWKSFQSWLG